VEIVRRIYTAAALRDGASVFAHYDPSVVIDASQISLGGLIGEPVRHGHDGARSFFRELHEAWDDLSYEVQKLIPAGDQVVSVVTRRGRGRSSGIEIEMSFALVWTFRDGRVTRLTWLPSRELALEAAGLVE
jgi:ketosteroid isomerase-like protein